MTVARPPRRRLIQGGVGLVCAGIALLALWLLAGYAGARDAGSTGTPVQATVRSSASCVAGDDHDTVTFTLSGQAHQAKLDGCGHSPGEVVTVLVPDQFGGDTVLEPTNATQGNSASMSRRVAFLLLVLAAGVSGTAAYLIFRSRRAPKPAAPALNQPVDYPVDYPEPVVARVGGGAPAEITGVNWFEDSVTSLPVDQDELNADHPADHPDVPGHYAGGHPEESQTQL